MKVKSLFVAILATMLVGTQAVYAQTVADATASNAATSNSGNVKKQRVVRAFEIELAGGIVTPTEKLHFDKNHLGWNAQAELRYNFKRLPLDLGLHVDGALFKRDGQVMDTPEDLKQIAKAKFTSITGLGVIDLNFLRSKGFSIFVGCGAGYAMLLNDIRAIEKVKDIDKYGCFCVMPRVGIELFHHVRATFYYKHFTVDKGAGINQDHFGASIGIVFGGGKKKAK